MSSKPTVECPTCKERVEWSEKSEFRPFCSDRCRLIDLGEWASGNRFIPEDAEQSDATSGELDKD